MRYKEIASFLRERADIPDLISEAYRNWLSCADVPRFLGATSSEDVPVYLCVPYFYLYSMFVKERKLKGNYVKDILKWNFDASGGWGYGSQRGPTGFRKVVIPPLDSTASKILDGSDPVFFLREFVGVKTYPEINQRFAHIVGIHWVNERSAYQRLDENGDYEDVAITHTDNGETICTVNWQDLEFYMFLTDTLLIRVFDVTRFSPRGNINWSDVTSFYSDEETEIFARHNVGGDAAYFRGFQVLRRRATDDEMMRAVRGERNQKYETFLTHDWKHGEMRECSCDPKALGNYFAQSDLPFEISPAFFRPDVMLKYKQDPDKYHIEPRSISCRGTWYLRYGINDEDQIFVYLKDLAGLPYAEQQYWKAFNELPKAGIPDRVFATDFKGERPSWHDPLISLKSTLRDFPRTIVLDGQELNLWNLDEDAYSRLSYVVTTSRKEWEDQILILAKLLVDGFKKGTLIRLAKRLGCYDDRNTEHRHWGTLKWIERCLESKGFILEEAKSILDPLRRVYDMRSHGIAHPGSGSVSTDRRQEFYSLLEDLLCSMNDLAELIKNGWLNAGNGE